MKSPRKLIALLSLALTAGAASLAPAADDLIIDLSPSAKPEAQVPKPKINYDALNKLGWKIGTQAYTFRHISTYEAMDQAAALGLQYIELYPGQKFSKEEPKYKTDHNMDQEHIDKLLAKAKECKLEILNYGVVGLDANEANDRKVFDWAKKMGIKTIVSEPPMDARPLLDKLTEEYNMNVALHNHPDPSPYWNPDTVLKFSEGLNPRIGSCADLGHWQRSGIKPIDAVQKLKSRVICSHVKDLNEFGKHGAHDVPWGTGVGGIKETLVEMKKQGLKVAFSIENERGYVGLVGDISKSLQFFSDVATELAGQ